MSLDKRNFQRVICKQRNWQWIFPPNVTFFVNVTLSRLVRISKTRYRWKDLSFSESYMGPERKICIVPYIYFLKTILNGTKITQKQIS